MAKNTPTLTNGSNPSPELVLSLLTTICQSLGHTFSWYSSKKGRTWMALKNNHGTPYSTNVEYTTAISEKGTLDAFAILMNAHLRKALQIDPPIPTWASGRHEQDLIDTSWEQLQEVYAEAYPLWLESGMALPPPISVWLKEQPEAAGLSIVPS